MPAKVRSTQLFTELYSADELHCRLMCTLSGSPGASFTRKLDNAQIPECLRITKAFTRASNASAAESRSMVCNCNVQSVPAGRHGCGPSIGSRRSHHEATPATRTSMHCFSFHPGPRTCPPQFQRERADEFPRGAVQMTDNIYPLCGDIRAHRRCRSIGQRQDEDTRRRSTPASSPALNGCTIWLSSAD